MRVRTREQLKILEVIQGFRYLPLKALVHNLVELGMYSHRQSVSRVLADFEQRCWIKSLRYGNNNKVLYLTREGARVLAGELGRPITDFPIPNHGKKFNFSMLEHTLKIVEIFLEVEKHCKANGSKLVKWVGDQNIRCSYEFRSNRSGKKIKRNLFPDSYFEIEQNGKIKRYFLEYDTGSMDKRQLAMKFMRYFEYFVYGDWEDRFNEYPKIWFKSERSEEQVDKLFGNEIFEDSVVYEGINQAENYRSMDKSKVLEFNAFHFRLHRTLDLQF